MCPSLTSRFCEALYLLVEVCHPAFSYSLNFNPSFCLKSHSLTNYGIFVMCSFELDVKQGIS